EQVVSLHCSVFSTELLQKPKKKRDSVIVHELLHLRYPNHGKMFHMMLRSYLGEAILRVNPLNKIQDEKGKYYEVSI
ncbi:MAG: M48 family metallopeptidase, partial [Candidatus Dadabacteria bacterium]|nr:M48 family metallopeptidase [Candidatus Dadabacteria bacterium]